MNLTCAGPAANSVFEFEYSPSTSAMTKAARQTSGPRVTMKPNAASAGPASSRSQGDVLPTDSTATPKPTAPARAMTAIPARPIRSPLVLHIRRDTRVVISLVPRRAVEIFSVLVPSNQETQDAPCSGRSWLRSLIVMSGWAADLA